MKLREILEAKEENLLPVDAIAMMLFKQKAGIIKDPKRDKDKTYLGVAHTKSSIKGPTGKALPLTFDNSTDSGEFELDSLTPLKIIKGSDTDKAIKKLFSKHELDVGTGYVVKGDETYLRELSLGKKLGRPAVKLVSDVAKLLKTLEGAEDKPEDEVKDETSDKKAK